MKTTTIKITFSSIDEPNVANQSRTLIAAALGHLMFKMGIRPDFQGENQATFNRLVIDDGLLNNELKKLLAPKSLSGEDQQVVITINENVEEPNE